MGEWQLREWQAKGTGLEDEAKPDVIPDAAGGEGSHEAAKPEGVIGGYVSYTQPTAIPVLARWGDRRRGRGGATSKEKLILVNVVFVCAGK